MEGGPVRIERTEQQSKRIYMVLGLVHGDSNFASLAEGYDIIFTSDLDFIFGNTEPI